MNTRDVHPASITLSKGAVHRLADGRGRRVEALSGSLWVTIDNDPRDVQLDPGHGLSVDHDGVVLISALDDARFVVLDALPESSY
jgi:hypothetical protein